MGSNLSETNCPFVGKSPWNYFFLKCQLGEGNNIYTNDKIKREVLAFTHTKKSDFNISIWQGKQDGKARDNEKLSTTNDGMNEVYKSNIIREIM